MMRLIRCISKTIVKLATRLLLRVEIEGMEQIPARGPVILVINHVNFIDAPLLYTLLPREVIGLIKVELSRNFLLGLVARSWGAIPIRRGELDLEAFRRAMQVLREGKMLGLAPEGTRSHHGRLLRGRPGAALLALHAPEALIVPMAIYGHVHYAQYWRRLQRTPVNLVFGQGFYLKPQSGSVTHGMRQKMTDEIMMQIAILLPPEYRGIYSDFGAATKDYLQFPAGATSNPTERNVNNRHLALNPRHARPADENSCSGPSGLGIAEGIPLERGTEGEDGV